MKKKNLLQTVRSDGSIDRPKSKPRTDLLDISIRDEVNLYRTALSDWRPTPDME